MLTITFLSTLSFELNVGCGVAVGGGCETGVDVAAGDGFGDGVDVAAAGSVGVGCVFGVGCGLDCATAVGGARTRTHTAKVAVATIALTRPRVVCFPWAGIPGAK